MENDAETWACHSHDRFLEQGWVVRIWRLTDPAAAQLISPAVLENLRRGFLCRFSFEA